MEIQFLELVLAFMICVAVGVVCTLAVATCCKGSQRAIQHRFPSPPNLFQALAEPKEQVALIHLQMHSFFILITRLCCTTNFVSARWFRNSGIYRLLLQPC
jgi:hypothetical protein